MKLEAIQAAETKLLLPTYERNPILFVDGSGMYLIADSGERYLDLLSGIGVNALGYAHPRITKVIKEQAGIEVVRRVDQELQPTLVHLDKLALLVELAAQPIYNDQPKMTEVMDILLDDGFTPVAFQPLFQSSDGLRMVEIDGLFMRSATGLPDYGPGFLTASAAGSASA